MEREKKEEREGWMEKEGKRHMKSGNQCSNLIAGKLFQ